MNITDHMNTDGTSSTIKQLVASSGKSETWVRTQIKKALTAGTIVQVGKKPATFKLAPKPEPKKTKAKKVNLNPQPLLQKMQQQAEAAGTTLAYDRSNRIWNLGNTTVTSQELAAIRDFGFPAYLQDLKSI